jgi:hypothetical protein
MAVDIRRRQFISVLGAASVAWPAAGIDNDRTVYIGMAQEFQEIFPSAVARGQDGYLRVDYDRLWLKFMSWDA